MDHRQVFRGIVRKISASRICLAPVIPQVRRARPNGAFNERQNLGTCVRQTMALFNRINVAFNGAKASQASPVARVARPGRRRPSFSIFWGETGTPRTEENRRTRTTMKDDLGRITLHTSAWAVRFSFHQKRSNRFLHRTDLSLDQGQQLFGHTPSHFLGAIVDSRQRGG